MPLDQLIQKVTIAVGEVAPAVSANRGEGEDKPSDVEGFEKRPSHFGIIPLKARHLLQKEGDIPRFFRKMESDIL